MKFSVNSNSGREYTIKEFNATEKLFADWGYINIVEYILLKQHLDAGIKEDGIHGNPGEVADLIQYYYNEAKDVVTFLAKNLKNECIGLITISKDKKGKTVISSIYVDEPYRNKGIAGSLLFTAISYLKEHRESSISISVGDFNKTAIKFYEKNGFKKDKSTGNKMHIYTLDLKGE